MTSRLMAKGARYVVIDDALSAAAFESWQRAASRATYQPTFGSVTAELDGITFFANGRLSDGSAGQSACRELSDEIISGLGLLDFPSTALPDGFRFWRYPRATGLDWHDDGRARSAAFTLYLSDEWRATWGGELEILDVSTDDVPCRYRDIPRDLMNSPVLPVAIPPRPNRLVLMVAGTFHRIRPVEFNAGDRLRRSLTGFVASTDAV